MALGDPTTPLPEQMAIAHVHCLGVPVIGNSTAGLASDGLGLAAEAGVLALGNRARRGPGQADTAPEQED